MGSGLVVDAHGIFISRDDRVFLVDRDGHRLLCFTVHGEFVFAIGRGDRPHLRAPFNHPVDVAWAPDGTIYVADGYGNSPVHRFSPESSWLSSWGSPGSGPASSPPRTRYGRLTMVATWWLIAKTIASRFLKPRAASSSNGWTITTRWTSTWTPYPIIGFRSDWRFPSGVGTCDGADDYRRAVREQLSYGVDWIKVYTNSGAGRHLTPHG